MNDLHRAAATAVLAAAGPWGGHSNGNIDLSLLTRLSWGSPQYLRPDAARALESLNVAYAARFGKNIRVTDAYRTYAAQVTLYEQKPDKAAKPGTSNHGWGLAVDLGEGINNFGTAQHVWMVANGPAYGWIHPPWARQGGGREEAWHFEYDGTTTPPTTPTDPTTPSMEDDMPFRIRVTSSTSTPSEVGKIYLAQFGPTGQCLFQHIGPEENGVHDLVKTPVYNVDHYQKDIIRKNIITREAAWKVT